MMSSNGITNVIRQRSTDDSDGTNDLEPQSNILSNNGDCFLDQRPAFCLSEEQRNLKSFHERKSDVDQAIEWIVKEIKFLKQQDQNLMRQFVKLRGVLNSIKSRTTLDRKISLPETSPSSPMSPLYTISEESPTTFFRDEGSPGLRRRAHTAPLSFDDGSDFGAEENYEHFAI